MKFAHLPIGQHFSYNGVAYHKVGPLTAAAVEGGAQRMIPRSAVVNIDGQAPRTEVVPAGSGVAAAVERYHHNCSELLRRNGADQADLDSLEQARRDLEGAIADGNN